MLSKNFFDSLRKIFVNFEELSQRIEELEELEDKSVADKILLYNLYESLRKKEGSLGEIIVIDPRLFSEK
jgi:hypothetical protein